MTSCCQTFKKAVDTVRILSADGVQKVVRPSGHADGLRRFAFTLWNDVLRFVSDLDWLGRDRLCCQPATAQCCCIHFCICSTAALPWRI